MPLYEVKDDGGNVNVAHHNRLLLVASVRETATPLGGGKCVSTTQSALAEFTPLECGGEMLGRWRECRSSTPQLYSTWVGG